MNETVQNRRPRSARTVTRAQPTRTNDPARTMADILKVATREFAV
jgi:hypothetical protein